MIRGDYPAPRAELSAAGGSRVSRIGIAAMGLPHCADDTIIHAVRAKLGSWIAVSGPLFLVLFLVVPVRIKVIRGLVWAGIDKQTGVACPLGRTGWVLPACITAVNPGRTLFQAAARQILFEARRSYTASYCVQLLQGRQLAGERRDRAGCCTYSSLVYLSCMYLLTYVRILLDSAWVGDEAGPWILAWDSNRRPQLSRTRTGTPPFPAS